ncbi:MAG TPA: hypothetical protein VJS88_02560, partial [Chthoniobacterales bacterium]|nr:hypothetical protein [Chthoniobacterales bacterium]
TLYLRRLLYVIGAFALAVLLTATPVVASRIVNVSTRADVGTGNNVVIAGIIIQGYQAETLVIRGLGPSLPFANDLANPTLGLYNSSGTAIAGNDDWQYPQGSEIAQSGLAPSNSLESAMKLALNPGSYTAILGCNGGCTGIGMVEVYDITTLPSSARLANMSTRAHAENFNEKETMGIIIQGSGNKSLLLRGIGPSIPLPDTLPNPFLQLYGPNGGLRQLNDNWRDNQQSQIIATGLPPSNDLESAMVVSVEPNAFTTVIQDNSGSTGIANIEVYDLDPAPTPFPTPTPPPPPPPRLLWNDTTGAAVYCGTQNSPREIKRTAVLSPTRSGLITVHFSGYGYGQTAGYIGPNLSPSSRIYPQLLDQSGNVLANGNAQTLYTTERQFTQTFNGNGAPFIIRMMVSSSASPTYNDYVRLTKYDVWAP